MDHERNKKLMGEVRNKCRTLEGNPEKKICHHMLDVNFTFKCPCITNIFPSYNQQNATFLDLFISTDAPHVSGGSPPIIRSTKLRIQLQVLSTKYFCLLLARMSWNCIQFHLILASS
jgi:hypothetical protein